MTPRTIAIDGPVGAGKSTVSDCVAKRLGILHLDTGAMYRAVGLAAIKSGIDPTDEIAVTRLCREGGAEIDVRYSGDAQTTLLCGKDVTDEIRTQTVSMAASAVSKYGDVRRMLVEKQRQIARAQPILMDGRDIGTVVLPDAPVKIYLTASNESRARRRTLQLREKGDQTPYEQVLAELIARDRNDMTRAIDPLRKAEDATVVDSSDLSFEETVQKIIDIAEARHERHE